MSAAKNQQVVQAPQPAAGVASPDLSKNDIISAGQVVKTDLGDTSTDSKPVTVVDAAATPSK